MLQGESFQAQHKAQAGAVDETDGGQVDSPGMGRGDGGEARPGGIPDCGGVGGGNFALPDERFDRRMETRELVFEMSKEVAGG